MKYGKLTLIRGIAGSGKSTLAKLLAKDEDVHIEADSYFLTNGVYNYQPEKIRQAHELCQSLTDFGLRCGVDVIVANTFIKLKELVTYFDIALKYNMLPHVIVCQGNYGSIHDVPEEKIAQMKRNFQYDISELQEKYGKLIEESKCGH